MTPRQLRLIAALNRVALPSGPRTDKRVIRSLGALAATEAAPALTPRQIAYLCRLAHRYRRQLSDQTLRLASDESYALARLYIGVLDQVAASTRDSATAIGNKLAALPQAAQLDLFSPPPMAGGASGVDAPKIARGSLA